MEGELEGGIKSGMTEPLILPVSRLKWRQNNLVEEVELVSRISRWRACKKERSACRRAEVTLLRTFRKASSVSVAGFRLNRRQAACFPLISSRSLADIQGSFGFDEATTLDGTTLLTWERNILFHAIQASLIVAAFDTGDQSQSAKVLFSFPKSAFSKY